MGLTRKRITSILLIILTIMSSFALYTYGNALLNQIFIVLHLGILITLAVLNNILSDKFVLVLFFLNAASLVITLAYHSAFGVSILFVNLLLACFVFNNIQVENNTFLMIHLTTAVLWTIITLFAVKGEYLQPNGDLYEYRLLGCTYQKNTIGIISLGCIYHFIASIERLKCRRLTKNIISLMIIVLFLIKIIESSCRSALMAVILFSMLYLTCSEIPYRVYYIIILLGIIGTGLFTIYYVNNVVEIDLGDLMGRTTFNRLGTWKSTFSLINKYPIFGSGTDFKILKYYDSAHNTVLSILKTIGIVPALSYAIFFVKRLVPEERKSYSKACQMAVISALIISMFESFYMESYLYLPFVMMLINPQMSYEMNFNTQ